MRQGRTEEQELKRPSNRELFEIGNIRRGERLARSRRRHRAVNRSFPAGAARRSTSAGDARLACLARLPFHSLTFGFALNIGPAVGPRRAELRGYNT